MKITIDKWKEGLKMKNTTKDHYERAIDEALKDVKNGDVRTSSVDDFFKRLHAIERNTKN